MVEAAGIEPSLEIDTSTTLSKQNNGKTLTADEVMNVLIDTLRTDSEHTSNTFLHEVCKIYAKWVELPTSVQTLMLQYDDLSVDDKELLAKTATVLMQK